MILNDFLKKMEMLPLEYNFSPLFYKSRSQEYWDRWYDKNIYPMAFQFYILSYARTKEIDRMFPRKLLFEDTFIKDMDESYEEFYNRALDSFIMILNEFDRKLETPIDINDFGYNYICNRLVVLLDHYDVLNFTKDEIKDISKEKIGYLPCYNICEIGEYLLEYKKTRMINEDLKPYIHWMNIMHEWKDSENNIIDSIYYPESDEIALNRIFSWYEDVLKRFHKEL